MPSPRSRRIAANVTYAVFAVVYFVAFAFVVAIVEAVVQ